MQTPLILLCGFLLLKCRSPTMHSCIHKLTNLFSPQEAFCWGVFAFRFPGESVLYLYACLLVALLLDARTCCHFDASSKKENATPTSFPGNSLLKPGTLDKFSRLTYGGSWLKTPLTYPYIWELVWPKGKGRRKEIGSPHPLLANRPYSILGFCIPSIT